MKKEKKNSFLSSIKISHKGLWITLLLLYVAFIGVSEGLKAYVNYLNVADIGEKYMSVYFTNIKATVICYTTAFVISMIVFCITSIIIKRNLLKWDETALYLKSKTNFILLNGAFAFVTAQSLPGSIPEAFLYAMNPTGFVYSDPIFGKNIGYYVFQRPFYSGVVNWCIFLFAFILIYSLTVYFMYYARNGAGGIKVIAAQPQIVRHVASIILIGYALNVVISEFWAESMFFGNTLTETSGGFTDMAVWLNFYNFTPFLLCIILIASVVFLIKKRNKYLLYTLLVYPAAWILIAIYAFGVQAFYVTPNKATIERPYTKYRIEYTNRAYGLDHVNETPYPLTGKINEESLSANEELLNSLIVTDSQNALNILNSRPDSKQFLVHQNIDVVPTTSGGKLSAEYISALELSLPADNKTLNEYNNRKMHYTHGYGTGVVAAQSTAPVLPAKFSQPRIYFGETEKDFQKDYIITGTAVGEYDPKSKLGESSYTYDGPAGVQLNVFNRLIYAVKYREPAILFSDKITDQSKIVFNRNVVERAHMVLPFLEIDENPYIVETSSGKLLWILDGYTTTNSFPYAACLYDIDEDFGTNYIRNSVKITVDAYTGEVCAYIIDWDDPIIRTISAVYPDVFMTTSLPSEIVSHLKYPEMLFRMQSDIYRTYHDTNPSTFYTNENAWEYAISKTGEKSSVSSLQPYYQILNSVNGTRELALVSAFTPAGDSESLAALMTVSSDINNYGELTLYNFPRTSRVFGTMKIESRIESDTKITEEISKLSSEGTVVYGPLTVVPIMDTICYIKPVYINSDSLKLARVIVACGDSVAIDSTLTNAFQRLSAMNPKSDYSFIPTQTPSDDRSFTKAEYNALILEALDKYTEAKQFQAEGDWVNYGKTMDEFEALLDEIRYDLNYPEETEEKTEE